ncbi:hypothetical protein [Pseudomonas cremoricolorata]|uniref:Uncharacterized protein n=1 Tax=Pseudomonas cremoricolorata TaxID=157783 RepID=A0A089WQP5_9PSED|nr:hypothetical protein [Pseudomonas cremoricolorata]AIR89484.1 hypothetical protein LK03_09410 [Pseudomonas cremoricolorata]
MASFWTLLLQRPRHRTYARLDGQGRCLAFKTCAGRPEHGIWVEVSEQRLAWLGQPLPQSARLRRSAGNRWQGRSVPA